MSVRRASFFFLLFAGLSAPSHAWAQSEAAHRELLADAAARVSFAQDAASSSGKDAKGFYLAGGEAKLYIGGFSQFRYYATFRDEPGSEDDVASGFVTRRTRLNAQGDLNKELSFKFELDVNQSGAITTTDAYAGFALAPGWDLRAGQFKLPLLKEELVSDTNQAAVERSTVNSVFTGARSQGVQITRSLARTRGFFMLSDGLVAINTPFDASGEADYAFTGRVEHMWAGDDFKRFDPMAGWQGKGYSGMIGGALHWQSGGETAGTADVDVFEYTLDATAKGDGWSTFLEFVGRQTDSAAGDFTDLGLVAQAGYFLAERYEVFARWSQVWGDDDRADGGDFPELTIGANHFLFPESQAARLSADVTIAFNDQDSASDLVSPSSANGLLATSEDNEVYFRTQFQLIF